MLILKLIAAYLLLGVEPDPPEEPDPKAGAGAEDPPDDEIDLDALEEPDKPDKPAEESPAMLRARAEKAERERDDERRARDNERQRQQHQAPNNEQAERAREDAWVAEESDPDKKQWREWAVKNNRTIRESGSSAKQALNEAKEIADKSAFDRWADKNPKLASKYADKVEAKLAEIRAGGGNLTRDVVVRMLIGDDVYSGRIKSTKKGDGKPREVDRGKPASPRGDVRARGASSESEKRRARLEGQVI